MNVQRPARPAAPRRRGKPGVHIRTESSSRVTSRSASEPVSSEQHGRRAAAERQKPRTPASPQSPTQNAKQRGVKKRVLPSFSRAKRRQKPSSIPANVSQRTHAHVSERDIPGKGRTQSKPAPAVSEARAETVQDLGSFRKKNTGPKPGSRVIDARDRFLAAVKPPPWQRTRKPFFIAVGVILVCAVIVVALLAYLPALKVAKIETRGTNYVSQESIMEVAGRTKGHALAFADAGQIESDLEEVSGIKAATVTRSWPNTLKITIVERVPAARLKRDSRTIVVDPDGAVLPAEAAKRGPFPLLIVPPNAEQQDGVQRALIEVLGALPADVRTRVTEVTATTPTTVTLKMNVGGKAKTVVWGGPEDSALKAQVLEALATQPGTVIDLTSPHAPTVR